MEQEVGRMCCGIHMEYIPEDGLALVNRLREKGFEAWFVGGCVRDLLMGKVPHDWDICTSARPEQTKAVVQGDRIHDIGMKHGTVLVIRGGAGYEITTYRTERDYSDHRRPDRVEFISELSGDLARRDFTINAMAYHPSDGVVDLFGGREDLKRGILRTVGDPCARFGEDALRMLRALRFAGRFAFALEPMTARAIHAKREDLRYISAERVLSELKGILSTREISTLLLEFSDIFGVVLPELAPLMDVVPGVSCCDTTCWEHTARVVDGVPPEPVLRLAALFLDAGKTGGCHFNGSKAEDARRSSQLAHQALMRLKSDKETRVKVEELLLAQGDPLPQTPSQVRRYLAKWGREQVDRLIALRRSDLMGQTECRRKDESGALKCFEVLITAEMQRGSCLSLDQLAVKGSDLLEIGIPAGPELGRRLQAALDGVLDGAVPNQREALLAYIKEM